MKELAKIQRLLKVPKGNYNAFGKYNYRSAEDILEAAKRMFAREGIEASIILTDEPIFVGSWNYIKATARLYVGDNLIAECSAAARESEAKKGMDASQITGAASSYARKFALSGLFGLDDTKDADTQESGEATDNAGLVAHLEADLEDFTDPKELKDKMVKLRDSYAKEGLPAVLAQKIIKNRYLQLQRGK